MPEIVHLAMPPRLNEWKAAYIQKSWNQCTWSGSTTNEKESKTLQCHLL